MQRKGGDGGRKTSQMLQFKINPAELFLIKNRTDIGLRSIDLRNNLIDVENETGINLHLPKGWQNEKITVANK